MKRSSLKAGLSLLSALALSLTSLLAQAEPSYQYRTFKPGLAVQSQGGPQATLQLSATSLDFGTLTVGVSAVQSVQLVNAGDEARAISAVQVSGGAGYSVATNCGESLAAGAACSAAVTFLPASYGVQAGLLTFSTSVGAKEVSLTGNGQGATAELSVTSLTLTSTHTGSAATPQTLTVTNNGNAPLVVQGATLSGPNAAEFSVAGCTAPVAPGGGSCTLTVGYTPASTSAGSATLTIASNALTAPSRVVSLIGVNSNTVDPYWSQTVLAINAESGITDIAGGNALTLTGGPTASTAQKKFGNASVHLGAPSAQVSLPNTNLKLGSRDFTIETWVRPSAIGPANQYLMVQEELSVTNNGHLGLGLLISSTGQFVALWNSGNAQANVSSSVTLPANTWSHLAITRTNGTITLWVNGVSVGSKAVGSTAINGLSSSAVTRIGKYSLEGDSTKYVGYLDDFRVTMDVARFTSNFPVPSTTFPAP